MSAPAREDPNRQSWGFFGVVTRTESYVGLLYLVISFPLGIFYFCLFLTWFFLGIGLSFIVIGIPILGLMFLAARALAGFERQLANWLLDAGIGPARPFEDAWAHPWHSLKACLVDSFTWKGLLFLFLKFPFGLASFIVTVVLVGVSAGLILTPLFYRNTSVIYFGSRIDSPEAAVLSLCVGLVLGVLSLYVTNGLAALWRSFCGVMLSPAPGASATPVRSGPIIIP